MKKVKGNTALMRASENGLIIVVQELIERGADVNSNNNDKKRRDKDIQH